MVLVGLGAAGKVGKSSVAVILLLKPVEEGVREGIGEGRALAADDEAHGVCPGFAPMRFADAGTGKAGKDDVEDQLA